MLFLIISQLFTIFFIHAVFDNFPAFCDNFHAVDNHSLSIKRRKKNKAVCDHFHAVYDYNPGLYNDVHLLSSSIILNDSFKITGVV